MINYIILNESDIREDKINFDVNFDITNPNRYDFKTLTRENINEADLIIYIYKDEEEDIGFNYKFLKNRLPENHYKDLIKSLLNMENIKRRQRSKFIDDYLDNLD